MGSGVQFSEFMVRVRCLGCRVFGSVSDFAIKIPESGGRMGAAETSGAPGEKDFSKSSGREATVQGRYGRFSLTLSLHPKPKTLNPYGDPPHCLGSPYISPGPSTALRV